MAKRLFLLLSISLFNIISMPWPLMAADEVVLSDINTDKVVKTVEEVKQEEPVEEIAFTDFEEDSYEDYEEPVYAAPSNSIAIAGRVLEIVDVYQEKVDSGDHVNKYGDKFLYGHNSNQVFGVLYNVGVGNVFTVVYNDVSTNYQVKEVVTYEKISDEKLRFEGVDYYARAIKNGRGKYDMVLMTCAGESYGNGDASHRLVIYANAI